MTPRIKVAWVRVDTQTVLTMSEHVITKNHRIKVSEPDSNVWRLEISDIRRTDAGHYMCQINTDPMQSQLAYLDVMGQYNGIYFGNCKSNTMQNPLPFYPPGWGPATTRQSGRART